MDAPITVPNAYWEVLEGAALPMAIIDRTGTYQFINRAGSEFFRYPLRAVVGRHFRDFLGGGDTESRGTMEQLATSGSAWVRREVRRGDGTTVTVDAVLSRLPDDTILIVGKDVTEEVRLAAALEQSAAHLRQAQSAGGIRFWEFDLAGQRMLWSTYPDSPGRWYALGDWLEIVDPRERAAVAQGLREVTETGQFFKEAKRFRITLPDGETRLMESRGRVERQPGGAAFALGIATDITESSRAIAQLQRSEARLRQAQGLARLGSWDWEPEDGRLRWTDATYRLYGLNPEEPITPERFSALVHPDDAERVARTIRAAIRDGAPWDYRFRALRGDGRTVWMHTRAEITRDASGRAIRVTGTTQDVTEAVEAEALKRETDELMQLMVDSLDEPIFMTDLDRRVVRSNRALQALLGATPEELAGRRLPEFIAPEDRGRFQTWRSSIGDAPTGSVHARFRIIGLDGVSHHVEPGFAPLYRDGVMIGRVGNIRDVTDQVILEHAVERQANELRAIVEGMPRPLLLVGEHCRILRANPATEVIFGWHPDDLVGRDVSTILSREDCELLFREIVASEAAPGQIQANTTEVRSIRRGEHEFPAEWTVARIPTTDPVVRDQFVVMVTDITERRMAEAQVRALQRNEALGTLVAGIAHDFNNLLTAISGAFIIARRAPGEEQRIEIGERATQRATDLVRRLLQFARREPTARNPQHIATLLSETLLLLRETTDRRIGIRLDAEADLPPVLGDGTQLQQVLVNLIVNARDAALERLQRDPLYQPQITVRLRAAGRPGVHTPSATPRNWQIVQVEDNGGGIPAAVLEKIFDPFFTTKPVGQGTGLGLATSLSIIREHHGTLSVQSEVGQGTTFTIALPPATEPGPTPSDSAPAASQTLHGIRVLLVDDEPTVQELGARILTSAGAAITRADNASSAIERFSQGAFDVVILDLNLPDGSGWSVLETLRTADAGIPVVVLSGFIDEDQRQRHTPAAAMTKPYAPMELLRTVAAVARRPA